MSHLNTILLAIVNSQEFAALQKYEEKSIWHENDNIMLHTFCVYAQLKQILQRALTQDKEYLEETLAGDLNRYELLLVASLLHDIAKPDTIVKKEDNTTQCPDHENKGAEKAKLILTSLKFSELEIEHVTNIIRFHGSAGVFTGTEDENELEVKWRNFLQEHGAIAKELLWFMQADLLGNDGAMLRPQDLEKRLDVYIKLIKKV